MRAYLSYGVSTTRSVRARPRPPLGCPPRRRAGGEISVPPNVVVLAVARTNRALTAVRVSRPVSYRLFTSLANSLRQTSSKAGWSYTYTLYPGYRIGRSTKRRRYVTFSPRPNPERFRGLSTGTPFAGSTPATYTGRPSIVPGPSRLSNISDASAAPEFRKVYRPTVADLPRSTARVPRRAKYIYIIRSPIKFERVVRGNINGKNLKKNKNDKTPRYCRRREWRKHVLPPLKRQVYNILRRCRCE